jgi:4-aminobutyrate aminotransferase-like enzyme
LAVLDVIEEEGLCERALALGETLRTAFNRMRARHAVIAEVRGLGAMTAIELCHGGDPSRPAADVANALKAEAAKRGLLLLSCGTYGNVMRIMVPLTISDAVLKEGLTIFAQALDAVMATL